MVSLKAGVGFKCIRCIKMPLANATLDNKPATFSVIYKGVDRFCFVHLFGSFLVT